MPGKSLVSDCATTRAGALAGNALASVPPQLTCRNGSASTSRAATIAVAYTSGLRITLVASRYQPPAASLARGRPADRRIRSALTRGPSTASRAGRTVSAASMSTSTVATPP